MTTVGESAKRSRPMALSEKQALASSVNSLDGAGLAGVVAILMRRVPSLQRVAGSEIQLDIDKLDPATLRELEAFVSAHGQLSVSATGSVSAPTGDQPRPAAAPAKRRKVDGVASSLPPSLAGLSAVPSPHYLSAKEAKAIKDREKALAKEQLLAGVEKILRAAASPMEPLDLVRRGMEEGHFYVDTAGPGAALLAAVSSLSKGKGKAAKKSPFVKNDDGTLGLVEWSLDEAARAAFVAERTAALETVPALASPPTRNQIDLAYAKVITGTLLRDATVKLYFGEPVDIVALNIPDYPTVIRNPMDLGTVKKKLADDAYTTIDEYLADVRLIWSNALLYNGATSQVGLITVNAQRTFEGLVADFLPGRQQLPQPVVPPQV